MAVLGAEAEAGAVAGVEAGIGQVVLGQKNSADRTRAGLQDLFDIFNPAAAETDGGGCPDDQAAVEPLTGGAFEPDYTRAVDQDARPELPGDRSVDLPTDEADLGVLTLEAEPERVLGRLLVSIAAGGLELNIFKEKELIGVLGLTFAAVKSEFVRPRNRRPAGAERKTAKARRPPARCRGRAG